MKMYSEILAINAWLVVAFDEVDLKKETNSANNQLVDQRGQSPYCQI